MKLVPLIVQCPQCASPNVVYSCNPTCCFNHVCGDCYATFELSTTIADAPITDSGLIPSPPDATNPTAPCARCGECVVFMIEENTSAVPRLVCASCKTILHLQIENIVPA
ncbi:MAG: hypothetical protein ACRD3T_09105 [Terriglobia bacterium]